MGDESHFVAVNVVYGALPHSGTLPEGYETVALPIVNEQLEKAGVRLAWMLNLVLRSSARPCAILRPAFTGFISNANVERHGMVSQPQLKALHDPRLDGVEI